MSETPQGYTPNCPVCGYFATKSAKAEAERDTLREVVEGEMAYRHTVEAQVAELSAQANQLERETGAAQDALAKAARGNGELRLRWTETLDFLKRCDTKDEIVSTGRLTTIQIANARTASTMYVEPGGGRGWVVRPSGPAPTWVGQQECIEALRQIDRETRSASDVTVLRLGSIARAALRDTAPREEE